MTNHGLRALYLTLPLAGSLACLVTGCAPGDPDAGATSSDGLVDGLVQPDGAGGIHKVKHVIIVMQENHSFDNYFGALAYAPGSPYHTPGRRTAGCRADDHRC